MSFQFFCITHYISFIIFVCFYSIYYLICYICTNKKRDFDYKKENFNNTYYPEVSIIIPIYNEIKVIDNKFSNIAQLNYPKNKLDIVFIDGGSNDGTANRIEELYYNYDLNIKIIKQGERKGFNNAVIEGLKMSMKDIVLISGAETEYDKNAILNMARHFENKNIGAVTGKQNIININDGFSPKIEAAYRNLYDFVRDAESIIDSPFDIKGEISCIRGELCVDFIKNPLFKNKGCIDGCFSFQSRLHGLKTVFDADVVYSERSPRLFSESFKQMVRRGATLIENMLIYKKMIFRRKFGAFGMFIMPSHFLMLCVLPFVFFFSAISFGVALLFEPINIILLLELEAIGILMLVSKSIQAFIKTQLALIFTNIKLLSGIETQKFERLESTRIINKQVGK